MRRAIEPSRRRRLRRRRRRGAAADWRRRCRGREPRGPNRPRLRPSLNACAPRRGGGIDEGHDASGARGVHLTARLTRTGRRSPRATPTSFPPASAPAAADRREHLGAVLDIAVGRRHHALGRPAVQHGRADEPRAKRARVRRGLGEDDESVEQALALAPQQRGGVVRPGRRAAQLPALPRGGEHVREGRRVGNRFGTPRRRIGNVRARVRQSSRRQERQERKDGRRRRRRVAGHPLARCDFSAGITSARVHVVPAPALAWGYVTTSSQSA